MRPRSFHKTGFTMVETLVSVATMTLLMTGMGSAILIASNSLPDQGNPIDAVIQAAYTVDQIAWDLRYGTSPCIDGESRPVEELLSDLPLRNWMSVGGWPISCR